MVEYILHDLAHRGAGAWSPNVWKVRLVLNYKGIPYRTEWIEHPQIESKFKSLGIPPNDPGPHSAYTVPVLQPPHGQSIMDSGKIVDYLESTRPQPSLHMASGLQQLAAEGVKQIGFGLLPIFMPRIPRSVLAETSVEWFHEARSKRFGMPLDELERVKGGEAAWKAAEPGFEDVCRLLSEHKKDEGPFILGSQVSYADFMIVALLESLRRVDQDIFERVVSYDDSFKRLHEACRRWMTRDD